MGKPSFTKLPQGSTQSSRSCSRTSAYSSRTSLLSAISTQKRDKAILRHKKKQRKSIQNLFNKLRDDTLAEDSSSSIVVLDDTVIHKPELGQEDQVDGRPLKSQKRKHSLIVLDDEEATENNNTVGPVCSTPLIKKSRSHKKLDVSNITKVENANIDLSKNEDQDKTQIINMNSFVTVDLTEDSATNAQTVIDLSDEDCERSLTDADYRIRLGTMNRFCQEFVNLPRLNKLKVINTIFSGCDIMGARALPNYERHIVAERVTQTDVEILIDDTIVPSRKLSRNSVGSNIYNPNKPKKEGLRMIVIDGSNVAMSDSHGKEFNVRHLQTCIDYFLNRGHVVKAFVPRFRCKYGKSSDPALLQAMNREGTVVFTPSREVMGRLICSYDDRFIVQCAAEFDAVIVSGDNYRDLMGENPKWRRVIENNLLMYTFVNDVIMFPKDPFGRYGRSLNQFLMH